MATEKNDIPAEHNNQNTVDIESPPSWEEVMAEKNTTCNNSCDKNSAKSQHLSLTQTKDISEDGVSHVVTNIKLEEILRNNAPKDEVVTDQSQIPENTKAISLVTYVQKFISCLKMMSALTTIISDVVLMACGLALIYIGSTVIKEKDDLVRVSLFYKKQYRAIGQSFVAFGIIYLTLIGPVGILGALLHRKKLLKWHNVWLLLNLVAEGVIFYIIFKHLNRKKDKNFSNFEDDFKKFYRYCMGDQKSGHHQCCCYLLTRKNDTICYDYFLDDSFESCITHEDLYYRTQRVLNQGLFYLPIFMVVQLTALCFGTIQSKVITSQETSLTKRQKKRVKLPKNKIQKIWQKCTHLIYRRILFCLFAIMLVIIFFLVKLWYNNFKIRVGGIEIDVIDFTMQQIEDNI